LKSIFSFGFFGVFGADISRLIGFFEAYICVLWAFLSYAFSFSLLFSFSGSLLSLIFVTLGSKYLVDDF